MRQLILIISFCCSGLAASAAAPDDFRTAALTAIYRSAPMVRPGDIRLLGIPKPNAQFLRVAVRKHKFDPSTGEWQLQLECVPLSSCVPAIAIVHSKNPRLFESRARTYGNAARVRPGDRLQVSANVGAVRLKKSVVCLQAGTAGDRVRVREFPGHRVFTAVVQRDGTLTVRGGL